MTIHDVELPPPVFDPSSAGLLGPPSPEPKPAAPVVEGALTDRLRPATAVGQYVVEGFLAEGGCGAVYVAHHRETRARAAVKVLHEAIARRPKMVERFLQEIAIVERLRHPGILPIHEVGELGDGRPFYVMDYLDGWTVDVLLQREGRLSPEEAFRILAPVCRALAAAHAAGVVHRDVKGSNIMVASGGGAGAVKLLDFGIAKLFAAGGGGGGLTTVGRRLGTPSSMAPEQILGEAVDARTDVYALGVLIHRMLTGRLPFGLSSDRDVARRHLEEPAPPPSRLAPTPPALDAVVLKCLEKRPERRFASAAEVLEALSEAISQRGPGAVPAEATTAVAAILVELTFVTDGDELDAPLAADALCVLDRVEETLRTEGFTVPLATGAAVLGARSLDPLPGAPPPGRPALAVAAALRASLTARPAPDARLVASIAVHAGEAVWAGARVAAGPVLRTAAWSTEPFDGGISVTPEARELLRAERRAGG